MVRLDLDVEVRLPEGVIEHEGELVKECRERAIEAALCAFPQEARIYIDGEDKEPARVFIEASDDFNVEEVRVESA
jgi:L-aminopeptidase/D-esterase-like protein